MKVRCLTPVSYGRRKAPRFALRSTVYLWDTPMTKLTLILLAVVVAMSGASATAKPEPERPVVASPSTAPLTRAESTRLRTSRSDLFLRRTSHGTCDRA